MQAIPVGENALVLLVENALTSECVQEVRKMFYTFSSTKIPGLLSVRSGLDCLMLEFEKGSDVERILKSAETNTADVINGAPAQPALSIPVCYEPPYAKDLLRVADLLGMQPDEIIDLHSSTTYDVWMIGFMPGYPYMGGLNEKLRLPRKAVPDLSIPAGSVAIADEFVGVYPFDSPGGWHVIGRTPCRVVDYSRSNPFFFHYGMRVRFYPLSQSEFTQYEKAQY